MAEGAPLLREYILIGIEGSNPSLTAISNKPCRPKAMGFFAYWGRSAWIRTPFDKLGHEFGRGAKRRQPKHFVGYAEPRRGDKGP